MTGRTSRIQKYMLCFQKICNFGKITILLKKNCKEVDFFLAIFKFLRAPLNAQQNFMLMKYNFFLSIFVANVIAFFVKNLPKLNILSVIAIDLVKIFKQTKNHLAHFIKVNFFGKKINS